MKGRVLLKRGEPLLGEGLVRGAALLTGGHHGDLEGSIVAVALAVTKTNGRVRFGDAQTLLLGLGVTDAAVCVVSILAPVAVVHRLLGLGETDAVLGVVSILAPVAFVLGLLELAPVFIGLVRRLVLVLLLEFCHGLCHCLLGGTSILLLFPTYLLVQNWFQFLFEIDDFYGGEGWARALQ